jgi:serine/threonine protein kinase
MDLIRTLGKYRIDSVLGKGSMGIVYRAFDPHLGRTVALKTIRKEFYNDAQREKLTNCLKNEAQAGSRLNHPNIVNVLDYGEEGNVAYIAMEIVEGASLATLLVSNEPIALPSVIVWMTDL